MKIKKWMSAMLAAMLLATGCVACGTDGAESSAPQATDPTTTTTTAATKDSTANGTTDTTGADQPTTDGSALPTDTTVPSTGTTTVPSSTGKPTTTKTTTGKTTATTKTPVQGGTKYDYTKYNLDGWLNPVWKGDTVYNETLMFVPDPKTKKIEPAPLLYTPTEIVSVRSFDLKTEYVEGVDYTVQNGCIVLTANTRIPTWKLTEYYRMTADVYDLPSISMPGHHLKYGDASLVQKQVCVTYKHNGKWAGYVPTYQGDKLPKTMAKLKSNSGLTIVYNGDSIMEGCDASSRYNIAPFTPTWQNMLTDKLKQTYGNNITAINTAVGGTTSTWGKNGAQNNIIQHNPDLVILNFGMNDGSAGMSADEYKANMQQIIKRVRQRVPNCEFILVSNGVPNPDAKGWTKDGHHQYPATLDEIAAANEGVAVVKMYEMQQYLLAKKRYWDTTSNNINHPSDFFVRLYGQAVAQALIPDLTK